MQAVYIISSVKGNTVWLMLFIYYKAYMSHICVKFVLILSPVNVLCYAISPSIKKDRTWQVQSFQPETLTFCPLITSCQPEYCHQDQAQTHRLPQEILPRPASMY
jgi:hypothetical protein